MLQVGHDENHGNHKININSCILVLLSVTGWGDGNRGNHKISVNSCILVLQVWVTKI